MSREPDRDLVRRARELERRFVEREAELMQDIEDLRRESSYAQHAWSACRVRIADLRSHAAERDRRGLLGAVVDGAAAAIRLAWLFRSYPKDAKRVRLGGHSVFDPAWYLARYPDVAHAGLDPVLHYLRSGAAEGRDPHPDFDTRWYLRTYPDVAGAGFNPLVHFIMHGRAEGRSTHPIFDPHPSERIRPSDVAPLEPTPGKRAAAWSERMLAWVNTHPRSARFVAGALKRLGFVSIEISNPQRIGHLVLEADSFIKDQILTHGRRPRAILIESQHGFANETIAEYLSRIIYVLRRNEFTIALEHFFRVNGLSVRTNDYAVAMYETALCYDVNRRWADRKPLVSLTADDRRLGQDALAAMGLPADAWFACVHARGGGYSPADEAWHSHRNVDIADFGPAMDLIADHGGWCIRMGDKTMRPMPARRNAIDYALSPQKSDRLDVILAARCRFFLGCASGLCSVATMFGTPAVMANMTPMSGAYSPGAFDLSIPQQLGTVDHRMLSIQEIFTSDIANLRLTEEFAARGLVPVNVSSDDIRDVVAEMLDRLEGRAVYTEEDERRQETFRSFLKPGHYGYGAASRIGREYLRKYLS